MTDHLGTVRDIVNAAGTLINHIDYDSFGNILAQTNAAAGDRFTYTGREFDAETGLYYYRARYYDPSTGRFISEDPIGFAAGDANLYRYVGNSPLNYIDPSGTADVAIGYAKIDADIAASAAMMSTKSGCFIIAVFSGHLSGAFMNAYFAPIFGLPSPKELGMQAGINITVSAISCLIFPPAQLANASFGAVAVALEAAIARTAVHAAAGAIAVPVSLIGEHFAAFARQDGNGESSSDDGGAEHTKNKRESSRGKHEEGKSRKKRDRGGEKGDKRRPYRRK